MSQLILLNEASQRNGIPLPDMVPSAQQIRQAIDRLVLAAQKLVIETSDDVSFRTKSKIFCSVQLTLLYATERRNESIDHFTVVCLVAWPLNESEAGVDLVLIETSLLFICKFLLISMRTASLTRARKIFEFHLARWASNSQLLLVRGTYQLAQVFILINNS